MTMHPTQLRLLAADRQRELLGEANRHRLMREASSGPTNRPRTRRTIIFDAPRAFMRRYRRKLRLAFAADESYVLDDRPIEAAATPIFAWREQAARAQFTAPAHAPSRRD